MMFIDFPRETMGFPYLFACLPQGAMWLQYGDGWLWQGRQKKRLCQARFGAHPLRFGMFWGLVLDVFLWEWFIIHPPKKISVFQLRSNAFNMNVLKGHQPNGHHIPNSPLPAIETIPVMEPVYYGARYARGCFRSDGEGFGTLIDVDIRLYWFIYIYCLVGGLEHFLFSIIYGIILPID
jgi:hypothetical protein